MKHKDDMHQAKPESASEIESLSSQTPNLFQVQQRFFNIEEHNLLRIEMKKSQSEEGFPQLDTWSHQTKPVSSSYHNTQKKRGSLQLPSMHDNNSMSSSANVRNPSKQHSLKNQQQQSEVMSLLSSQYLNFASGINENQTGQPRKRESMFLNSAGGSNISNFNFIHSQININQNTNSIARQCSMCNSNAHTCVCNAHNNAITPSGQSAGNINNTTTNNNTNNINNLQNINNSGGSAFSTVNGRIQSNSSLIIGQSGHLRRENSTTNMNANQPNKRVSRASINKKKRRLEGEQRIREESVRVLLASGNNLNDIKGIDESALRCGNMSVRYRVNSPPNFRAKQVSQSAAFEDQALLSTVVSTHCREIISDLADPLARVFDRKEQVASRFSQLVVQFVMRVWQIVSMQQFSMCLTKSKMWIQCIVNRSTLLILISISIDVLSAEHLIFKAILGVRETNTLTIDLVMLFCLCVEAQVSEKLQRYNAKLTVRLIEVLTILFAVMEIVGRFCELPLAVASAVRVAMIIRYTLIPMKLSQIRMSLARNANCNHLAYYTATEVAVIFVVLICILSNSWCGMNQVESYHQIVDIFSEVVTSIFSLSGLHGFSEMDSTQARVLIAVQAVLVMAVWLYIGTIVCLVIAKQNEESQSICNAIAVFARYGDRIGLNEEIFESAVSDILLRSQERKQIEIATQSGKWRSILLKKETQNLLDKHMQEFMFRSVPELAKLRNSLDNGKMVRMLEEVTVMSGEKIINAGEVDDSSIYVIIAGEVQVVMVKTPSLMMKGQKTETVVKTLSLPRKASVVSCGVTRLLKFRREALLSLLDSKDFQIYSMIKDGVMYGVRDEEMQRNGEDIESIKRIECYLCCKERNNSINQPDEGEWSLTQSKKQKTLAAPSEEQYHFASECPKMHLMINYSQRVQQKHFQNAQEQEERTKYTRRRNRGRNPVVDIIKIQRAVSGILDDTLIQGLLSEEYTSENQAYEDEIEKRIFYDSILLSQEFSDAHQQQLQLQLQLPQHIQIERDNLSRSHYKKHSSLMPATPDKWTNTKSNFKSGSQAPSIEDDFEEGNNDNCFSVSSFSNKMKKTEKQHGSSPHQRGGSVTSISSVVKLKLDQNQNRYNRSFFQEPETLSSISHQSTLYKQDSLEFLQIQEFKLTLDIDSMCEFVNYFPNNNYSFVIERVNLVNRVKVKAYQLQKQQSVAEKRNVSKKGSLIYEFLMPMNSNNGSSQIYYQNAQGGAQMSRHHHHHNNSTFLREKLPSRKASEQAMSSLDPS